MENPKGADAKPPGVMEVFAYFTGEATFQVFYFLSMA